MFHFAVKTKKIPTKLSVSGDRESYTKAHQSFLIHLSKEDGIRCVRQKKYTFVYMKNAFLILFVLGSLIAKGQYFGTETVYLTEEESWPPLRFSGELENLSLSRVNGDSTFYDYQDTKVLVARDSIFILRKPFSEPEAFRFHFSTSLQVADSFVSYVLRDDRSWTFVVDSIQEYNGQRLHYFHSLSDEPAFVVDFCWIEGVGERDYGLDFSSKLFRALDHEFQVFKAYCRIGVVKSMIGDPWEEDDDCLFENSLRVLSVQNVNATKLRVYPNPSTGVFKIKNVKTPLSTMVEVYDITGGLLYSEKLISETLDLSHLYSAVYYLKIYGQDEASETHKIIIQ